MDRCIHTHPIKKPVDIDVAYAAGIRTFVVENLCEVQKFAGPAGRHRAACAAGVPQSGREIRPVVRNSASSRPTPNCSSSTLSPRVCSSQGSASTSAAKARRREPYGTALSGTLDLISHIAESLGVHTRVIDIGGGFPVAYREPMPTIDAIGDVIDAALGSARDDFALLAEPGRYLAADCMTLLTSVVGTAERDGQVWHYLDDGVYGSYSNVMTEDVHPPILALRELTEDGASDFEQIDARRADM